MKLKQILVVGLLKNEGSVAIKTMKYKKTFRLTKAILIN